MRYVAFGKTLVNNRARKYSIPVLVFLARYRRGIDSGIYFHSRHGSIRCHLYRRASWKFERNLLTNSHLHYICISIDLK